MPHIHTEPDQHDLTASAYVIRLDYSSPSVMLHLHKKLHVYLQFGGHVELNENPWQAIIHELSEESGYNIGQLKVLQPAKRLSKLPLANLHPHPITIQTHKFPEIDHYHTDIAFVLVTSEPPNNPVKDGESSKFKLFNLNDLNKASSKDLPIDVKETCIYVLTECLKSWKPISVDEFNS
jgi:8-oxo-dGTP diphosphatase